MTRKSYAYWLNLFAEVDKELEETKEERKKEMEERRKDRERREKLTDLELYIEDGKLQKQSDNHYSREFGDGWVTHTVHCHKPFGGKDGEKFHAYIDTSWKDPWDSPEGQTVSLVLDRDFDTLTEAMWWAMHLCWISERAVNIGERRIEEKYKAQAEAKRLERNRKARERRAKKKEEKENG